MNRFKLAALVAVVAVVAAVVAAGFTVRADDMKDMKGMKTEAPKPYPLDTCLVCGMKLGGMGKPYVFVHEGQEIKVCDESEKAVFDKDPKKFMAKLAAAAPNPYPLDYCLVCGMKFDGMDKPYRFVYHGQEIKVCDKSEQADFEKEPAKYLKQLAEAEAKLKH